jgi:hypothetical protein
MKALNRRVSQFLDKDRSQSVYPHKTLVKTVQEEIEFVRATHPRDEVLALKKISYKPILAPVGSEIRPEAYSIVTNPDVRRALVSSHSMALANSGLAKEY